VGLVQPQSQVDSCGGEEGEADDRAPGRAYRSPAKGDGQAAEERLTNLLCVPITDEDAASDFDCGVPALNTYFHKRAVSNDRRGLGKTYVLHGSSTGPAVLGFHTLSMADVETATLPRKHRSDVPAHPLPVALIGRLARDLRAKSQGVGETLLVDAFRRIVPATYALGCYGVIVDAKDSDALAFYQRYGFEPLPPVSYPRRMFIAIDTVRSAAR
jgi:GNAT superfamily N-acetyltransferase